MHTIHISKETNGYSLKNKSPFHSVCRMPVLGFLFLLDRKKAWASISVTGFLSCLQLWDLAQDPPRWTLAACSVRQPTTWGCQDQMRPYKRCSMPPKRLCAQSWSYHFRNKELFSFLSPCLARFAGIGIEEFGWEKERFDSWEIIGCYNVEESWS